MPTSALPVREVASLNFRRRLSEPVSDAVCGLEAAGAAAEQQTMLALEEEVQAADAHVVQFTRDLEDARHRAARAKRDLAQARRRAG